MDSIQEQIVKRIAQALGQITTTNGYQNTITSVQRLNQDGVDLAVVPALLIKEGDCNVELPRSVTPSILRRMELFVVAITRQDETPTSLDTRSGGEQLNSLVADIERVLSADRMWGGLAIMTDPPSYLEVEMDAITPHLARGMRFEVMYEHVRGDPYNQ